MFVLEEGNSILVYNALGKLVYKSPKIIQYRKFNADSLVILTESTLDFVNETDQDNRRDVTVVSDTRFISAFITDDLVFVQRKIGLPILDVYNKDFVNVLRLYQNIQGDWVYFLVKMKIPYKTITPTHLDGKMLYGTSKGKPCSLDLESLKFNTGKIKPKGVFLGDIVGKFRIGEVQ